MTAIVTCGETRQSLCAVRALGRAGIPVAVGANKRPCLSMWSRFATSTLLTEAPETKPFRFVEQLAEELRGRYGTCALVSTDSAFWAISAFREHLPIGVRKILPPHYSVVRSLDLEALHLFAQSLGIPCAPFLPVPQGLSSEELTDYLAGLSFPILLKPAQSFELKPIVMKSAKHWLSLQKSQEPLLAKNCLASLYKSERALSYFGVADKGHVLVEGFSERLSELEPFGEISTKCVTIEPLYDIREYSAKLLSALLWQGPFKLEFIKDHDGHTELVSLIGRLWGSLQLSLSAGMNIPLICYRLAEGTLTKDLLSNAKPDVLMRWLVGDASALFKSMTNLGRYFPKKLPAVKTWRRKRVATCYDVLDLEDPMPFLFELQHNTWRRAFAKR